MGRINVFSIHMSEIWDNKFLILDEKEKVKEKCNLPKLTQDTHIMHIQKIHAELTHERYTNHASTQNKHAEHNKHNAHRNQTQHT